MDRLWAPWRNKYVIKKTHKGCIFCKAARAAAKDFVIFKTRHSLCMLNIFPYNSGHLMVSPIRHTKALSSLDDKEALDLFRALAKAQELLKTAMKPHGYNIGFNLEKSAGAGVTGHLHIHIVPRWLGDTNFMPVLADTRVITQSLRESQKLLRNAYSKTNKKV